MNPVPRIRERRRGQPLVALAVIAASWLGARALAWNGVAGSDVRLLTTADEAFAAVPLRGRPEVGSGGFTPWPQSATATDADASVGAAHAGWDESDNGRPDPARGDTPMLASGVPTRPSRTDGLLGWTLAAGNAPASGLAERPSDRGASSPGGNAAPFPVAPAAPAAPRRWSGDAWLLARRGAGPSLAGGPAPASYGASQAGAILRYALAPASSFRPSAYARVSSAVSGIDAAEAALGLSARPLPRVPVIALGELRATRSSGRLRLRPAAMLVTQVPPLALPLGLTGEVYAQGGYVAGRGATPFADGQFTFDRPLASVAGHRLRIGGGVWGGAQKGAARFDLGPAARVDLKIGSRIFTRLSLDYRLRVAGKAEPGSGPVLTAAAGF